MTPSELDRGALAALDLLKRGQDTSEGEERIEETLETIREAIAADGLPVVIRRQMDHESDFIDPEFRDNYGPFPTDLAEIARGVPKTVWLGSLRENP